MQAPSPRSWAGVADSRRSTAGLTLRRRTGGDDAGWHLKVPAGTGARSEVRLPLGRATRTVPEALQNMVWAHSGGAPLRPVAAIITDRTVRRLVDATGQVLAEVADDRVSARRLRPTDGSGDAAGAATSWREIEVELVGGRTELLDAVDTCLRARGLRQAASSSKLAQLLGGDGRVRPAERTAAKLTTESTAGDVVLAHVREQVEQVRSQDLPVRLDAPDAVHKMRVATRRAALLNAATRPFHVVNFWGSVAAAQVLNHTRMGPLADRTIAALQRRLAREPEAALKRGMPFPSGWDPYFGYLTLAEVYRYPTRHFEQVRAQKQPAVLTAGGDLHRGGAGPEPDHDGVVAEPLDLVGVRGTLPVQAVGGHELVAEQEGRLRPDEHVANPPPVAAAPLRTQPVDRAVRCPDRAGEDAGLVPHPPLAAEHGRDERNQHDKVHAEHGEQRNDHRRPPPSGTWGAGPERNRPQTFCAYSSAAVSTVSPEPKCGPPPVL
jgi:hypothetical protein